MKMMRRLAMEDTNKKGRCPLTEKQPFSFPSRWHHIFKISISTQISSFELFYSFYFIYFLFTFCIFFYNIIKILK